MNKIKKLYFESNTKIFIYIYFWFEYVLVGLIIDGEGGARNFFRNKATINMHKKDCYLKIVK